MNCVLETEIVSTVSLPFTTKSTQILPRSLNFTLGLLHSRQKEILHELICSGEQLQKRNPYPGVINWLKK